MTVTYKDDDFYVGGGEKHGRTSSDESAGGGLICSGGGDLTFVSGRGSDTGGIGLAYECSYSVGADTVFVLVSRPQSSTYCRTCSMEVFVYHTVLD